MVVDLKDEEEGSDQDTIKQGTPKQSTVKENDSKENKENKEVKESKDIKQKDELPQPKSDRQVSYVLFTPAVQNICEKDKLLGVYIKVIF